MKALLLGVLVAVIVGVWSLFLRDDLPDYEASPLVQAAPGPVIEKPPSRSDGETDRPGVRSPLVVPATHSPLAQPDALSAWLDSLAACNEDLVEDAPNEVSAREALEALIRASEPDGTWNLCETAAASALLSQGRAAALDDVMLARAVGLLGDDIVAVLQATARESTGDAVSLARRVLASTQPSVRTLRTAMELQFRHGEPVRALESCLAFYGREFDQETASGYAPYYADWERYAVPDDSWILPALRSMEDDAPWQAYSAGFHVLKTLAAECPSSPAVALIAGEVAAALGEAERSWSDLSESAEIRLLAACSEYSDSVVDPALLARFEGLFLHPDRTARRMAYGGYASLARREGGVDLARALDRLSMAATVESDPMAAAAIIRAIAESHPEPELALADLRALVPGERQRALIDRWLGGQLQSNAANER